MYSLDVAFNSVLTHEFVVMPLPFKGIIVDAELLNKHQLKIDFGINGIIKNDEVVSFSNLRPYKTLLPVFSVPIEDPAEESVEVEKI